MAIADKLTTIAENVPKVYEAGRKNGREKEYDEFWDTFQQNGSRADYAYAFSGYGWDNETFRPKYDIKPSVSFARGLCRTNISGSLSELLEKQRVTLDTSNVGYSEYIFEDSSKLTEIPLIVGNYSISGLYSKCRSLKTASISVNEKTTMSLTFNACGNLENLMVVGTIGVDVDLHWSTKLSKASITNIINVLSASVSGKTVTFSQIAVDNIDWTGTVIDGVTYNSFEEIADIKTNWTISLV